MILKDATTYCPDGNFRVTDLSLSNIFDIPMNISAIGQNLPADDSNILECRGQFVLPGLFDMHVHFREPGYSYKETIRTGSEAAVAGGFSGVCTMPNLNPVPDSPENLQEQLDIIERDSDILVLPFASITKGRMGKELVDFDALADKVAGFSDDGSGVQSEEVMLEAMKRIAATGKVLSAHCEVDSLLRGGYIHDGEYARAHSHRGICSESEWREVERDIRLAEMTGCRLHICHVSTKESVELVRQAKKRGLPVTCETGPHYLTFCDEDLQEEGRFKMNPPLRSRADMIALREGVADGTIDAIATDHAPHAVNEKAKGLEKSAMGVVGLETAIAAVYTSMVVPGLISMERLVEAMAIAPRRIIGVDIPKIAPGETSNLIVFDPEEEWTVIPDEFETMGRATPYDGMTLRGKVKLCAFPQVYATYRTDSL